MGEFSSLHFQQRRGKLRSRQQLIILLGVPPFLLSINYKHQFENMINTPIHHTILFLISSLITTPLHSSQIMEFYRYFIIQSSVQWLYFQFHHFRPVSIILLIRSKSICMQLHVLRAGRCMQFKNRCLVSAYIIALNIPIKQDFLEFKNNVVHEALRITMLLVWRSFSPVVQKYRNYIIFRIFILFEQQKNNLHNAIQIWIELSERIILVKGYCFQDHFECIWSLLVVI